jgi:hypothetical protein
MDPHELFECVGVEWGRVGGQKVYLKAFSSFNTDVVVMALQGWNCISGETLLDEFRRMFKETKELINDQMDLECRTYEDYPRPIPMFNIRLMNPKLKGEDTTQYQGWPTSKVFKRKAIHIEEEMKEADYIHTVVDAMKNSGIVMKYWGKNLHLSNILRDKRGQVALLPGELQKLYGMAREHVNFNATMTSNVLIGIEDLDKTFQFRDAADPDKVAGEVSLRHLLYNYVFLPDGHSLCVEIHHRSSIADVEAIVPNTPASKTMIEEMNKNVAAYLYFYLQEHNIPEEFLQTILRGSMDPLLCQQINKCKWEVATKKLILPKDREQAAAKALSEAAWYKDEFGGHMADSKKKQQPDDFVDEDFMYDHDAEKSINTIHEKKGSKKVYKGSPNAPVFSLGRPNEVPASEDANDISEISALSKDELVKLCKSLQIKNKATKPAKGSPPDNLDQKASDKASRDGKKDNSAHSVESSSSSSVSISDSSDSTTTKANATSTPKNGGSEGPSQASNGE